MTSKPLNIFARDGVTVSAEHWPGDGETVVLVHGLGFSRRHWAGQVEALTAGGYGVVAIDLRGFGGSELPAEPYPMATLAEDLEAVRAALGLERFHLVGHSMGGMVALRYVVDRPERVSTLTLASTSAHSGRRAEAFARAMAILSAEGFDQVVADPARKAEVEAIIAEVVPFVGEVMALLRGLAREPSRARSFAWRAIGSFSVKDQLGAIRCPTLVLHGDADQNIPFPAGELIHKAIAHSEWAPLEGVAHNLPLEARAVLNERLLDFLARAPR